jgi:hypothetical protein
MSEPGGSIDPTQAPAWRSYLMPGTDVLRKVAELTDPTAVTIVERIVSADAEAALQQDTDQPKTFDLAPSPRHPRATVRRRTHSPVRCATSTLSLARPASRSCTTDGSTLYRHHPAAAAGGQPRHLHRSGPVGRPLPTTGSDAARPPLSRRNAPQHPRLDGLAHHAGHELDWTRSSAEPTIHLAVAAANGDYEPMRAC